MTPEQAKRQIEGLRAEDHLRNLADLAKEMAEHGQTTGDREVLAMARQLAYTVQAMVIDNAS